MQEFEFISAQTVGEACRALASEGSRAIAGGTDVIPRLQRNLFPAATLVDISRLAELRFIKESGEHNRRIALGALTSYSDMLESELLQQETPALVDAVYTVGCPQTRYRGTVGGNIVNASPAGDTLPPLLVLDASLLLVREDGQRTMPLSDFFVGPGQTALQQGELLHTIFFPRPSARSGDAFIKLGNRRGMNIAVASVGAYVELADDGAITTARVAFGSVAPTPRRSPAAEAVLTDQPPSPELFRRAAEAAQDDISPIGDVRASADYRRHAAAQILQRALDKAVAGVAREKATA